MDEKVKSLIGRIKTYLTEIYGGKVKKVMLCGSYVRGEASRNSDIDMLVLVDPFLNPFEVRESLSDLLVDVLLEEGELISAIVVPEGFYNSYNSVLILYLKKERVAA